MKFMFCQSNVLSMVIFNVAPGDNMQLMVFNWTSFLATYHILLVSSSCSSYYNRKWVQQLTETLIPKSHAKYSFVFFNALLHGDYPRVTTIKAAASNR